MRSRSRRSGVSRDAVLAPARSTIARRVCHQMGDTVGGALQHRWAELALWVEESGLEGLAVVEHRPGVELLVELGGWASGRTGKRGNDLVANMIEVVEVGADRL